MTAFVDGRAKRLRALAGVEQGLQLFWGHVVWGRRVMLALSDIRALALGELPARQLGRLACAVVVAAGVHRAVPLVRAREAGVAGHAYPTLGDRPTERRPAERYPAWVKGLELAPATVGVIHGIASQFEVRVPGSANVFNPCDGTKLPKVQRAQIVPLTTDQVEAVRAALPAQLQALGTLAVGTGMRQGECFGSDGRPRALP